MMKILGELPGTQEGEDNIEGLIKALDVDGDGTVLCGNQPVRRVHR